jgi:hypothetical protein
MMGVENLRPPLGNDGMILGANPDEQSIRPARLIRRLCALAVTPCAPRSSSP